MRIEKVFVTPGLANQMLEKNIKNRSLSGRIVKKYTDQMKNGEWQEETGETVKVAKDGTLLDGQHRLQAIINSGKSFNFLIVYDLPNKSFEVIDTGKPRFAGDALKVVGVSAYYSMSALIRGYLLLKDGKTLGKQADSSVTVTRIVEGYQERPDFWLAAYKKSMFLYLIFKKVLTASFIGSWYVYLSEFFQPETELFFQKLCSGIGIMDEQDPINILRNVLIENKLSEKKLTIMAKNAYLTITWNSFLLDKRYKSIPFAYGKDELPKPIIDQEMLKKEKINIENKKIKPVKQA